jgi:hypothetical protein
MTTIMVTLTTPSTADVLNQAADYLEQHGWIQGGLGTPDGPRCVAGAIGGLERGRFCEAWLAFTRYLKPEHPATWNDAPGRTKGEVVAALRAAALLEAGRNE